MGQSLIEARQKLSNIAGVILVVKSALAVILLDLASTVDTYQQQISRKI